MAKKEDVAEALNLLREQMHDTAIADGVRQGAAKALLAYHSGAKDSGTTKKRESSAFEAANRFRRVK